MSVLVVIVVWVICCAFCVLGWCSIAYLWVGRCVGGIVSVGWV